MHGSRALRGCLLACALLAMVGCEDGKARGTDEPCVICIAGGGGFSGDECGSFQELPCDEGLYCANARDRKCHPWQELGERCDEGYLCRPGLVCGHGATCEEPLPAGARCDARSFCVEGTACNSGGVPADPRAGTCEPLAAREGAPCAWVAGPGGWTARGCADGLACAPLAPFDPEAALAAMRSASDAGEPACCAVCEQEGSDVGAGDLGSCLGWPGRCRAPGLGAAGDPCTGDAGCASGACVVLPPPRLAHDLDPSALAGVPWPGVCAGGEHTTVDRVCDALAGCEVPCESDTQCVPGTLCVALSHTCFPARLGDVGAWCGQTAAIPYGFDDRICGYDMACDVDRLTCRLARGAGAGQPCTSHEDCGPGLACAGTCTAYGEVGDPCDVDRRCDFDLRCGRDTLRCETPGQVYQGGECQADADCGKGLWCAPHRGTCEWLARLGEACSELLPCEPGLACSAPPGGAGVCQRP